ncbi:alpha/beta hydrolase (plasmid) [Klebsiella aerogenes]
MRAHSLPGQHLTVLCLSYGSLLMNITLQSDQMDLSYFLEFL